MTRQTAQPYIAYIVDDALSARAWTPTDTLQSKDRLVGWQCGFEPLFVVVRSYLNVRIDDEEAEEIARDYLAERNWFANGPKEADYIL